MVDARMGQLNLGSPPTVTPVPNARHLAWGLDNLGNWTGNPATTPAVHGLLRELDTDGDGALDSSSTVDHAVNSENEIVSISDGASVQQFVHDRAGNLVFDGAYLYQYDAWNRLVEVYEAGDPGAGGLTYTGEPVPVNDDFDADGNVSPHPDTDRPGKMLYRFLYDGLGRLMATQTPIPNSATPPDLPLMTTEHYYYDGVRRLQEVVDRPAVPPMGDPPTGGSPAEVRTEREYVYGPDYVDEFVLQEDNPGSTAGGGNPGPQVFYMLQDANYNVVALLDNPSSGTAQVLAQYTYEPYGTRAAMDVATIGGAPAQNGGNENIVGHQGLFFYRLTPDSQTTLSLDPATVGFYYNRNRWYSPHLGRFLQKDPNESGLLLTNLIWAGEAPLAATAPFDPNFHFTDGMNLFFALDGNPILVHDPAGTLSYIELLGAVAGGTYMQAVMLGSVVGTAGYFTTAMLQGMYWRQAALEAALFGATCWLSGAAGGAVAEAFFGASQTLGGTASLAATGGLAGARMAAGFAARGTPIIIDTSLGVNPNRVAAVLRDLGYNAQSVLEIFEEGVKDPVIRQKAVDLGARVVASDRGRPLGEGFGSLIIRVPNKVQQVESVVRYVEAAIGKPVM